MLHYSKLTIIISLFLVLPLLVFAVPQQKAAKKDTTDVKAKIDKMIKEGDEICAKRENKENAMKAIEKYKEALELNPKYYEAIWRVSRAYYYYGFKLPEDDEDAREAIHKKGITWGKSAIKYGKNRPEGYYWTGINSIYLGEVVGIAKGISMLGDIKDMMNMVIKIDPSYDAGGAYRWLGVIEYELPGLFGGDNDESIMYLRKALELGPENVTNYVYLAQTLEDEDYYKEAKKLLDKALSMKIDPRWSEEHKKIMPLAKELMEDVMDELED